MNNERFLTTKTIAKMAVLAAVAFVLMLFDFSIPFVPSFYKLDFSELPVLVGGFALGPLAAVIIEAVKIILNVLFTGSATAYVGEFANFVVGCAFCVPAVIYYQKNKTKEGAIKGMILGTCCLVLTGMLVNYFVMLPAYSYFFHMPMDVIIGMGTALVPLITNRFTFVLLATSPFNLVKGVLVSILTQLIYKRISPLLKK